MLLFLTTGQMKNNFNILIAPDSFKESLTAIQVCDAIEKGIRNTGKKFNIQKVPMADGGEGTLQSLVDAKNGTIVQCISHDPLMRPIKTKYGVLDGGKTAVIEMAQTSGLELLTIRERNPLCTTTYGTGELIKNALDQGCENIIIGIGGSATNDGGAGMLDALGVQFLNNKGNTIPKGGGGLSELYTINTETLDPRLHSCNISVACDVTNPLLGEKGATRVFGKQKGASDEMLVELENNLHKYSGLLENSFGKKVATIPGSGAAGGLGAGLLALPNCQLRSGFEIVKELVELEQKVDWANLIFTGEGKTDAQTQFGKVPYGIAQIAKKRKIPVVCLSGTHGPDTEILNKEGITAIFSILDGPMNLQEAMRNTPFLLQKTAEQVMRVFLIQNQNAL